jgi:hypothetical protein
MKKYAMARSKSYLSCWQWATKTLQFAGLMVYKYSVHLALMIWNVKESLNIKHVFQVWNILALGGTLLL